MSSSPSSSSSSGIFSSSPVPVPLGARHGIPCPSSSSDVASRVDALSRTMPFAPIPPSGEDPHVALSFSAAPSSSVTLDDTAKSKGTTEMTFIAGCPAIKRTINKAKEIGTGWLWAKRIGLGAIYAATAGIGYGVHRLFNDKPIESHFYSEETKYELIKPNKDKDSKEEYAQKVHLRKEMGVIGKNLDAKKHSVKRGMEMVEEGIGCDCTIEDPKDERSVQSFLKRMDEKGLPRYTSNGHQYMIIGGKQGAFIFIPNGNDAEARVLFAFNADTLEACDNEDDIKDAAKMTCMFNDGITEWCKDNGNKHFAFVVYDEQNWMVRGLTSLPPDLNATDPFGRGKHSFSVPFSKQLLSKMTQLRDPDRKRKLDDKPVKKHEKGSASTESATSTLGVNHSGFGFNPDGSEYHVSGERNNCAFYSAIAAKKYMEAEKNEKGSGKRTLESHEVIDQIIKEGKASRREVAQWLRAHANDPHVQERVRVDINEGGFFTSLQSRLEEKKQQSEIDTIIGKLKDPAQSVNTYSELLEGEDIMCGGSVHYAMANMWNYEIDVTTKAREAVNDIFIQYLPAGFAEPKKGILFVNHRGNHYSAKIPPSAAT